MKRTTISLPEKLARVVEDEARRRGTSVSEVVRRSIVDSLVGSEPRELPFAGLFDDPEMTPASEIEAELERSWTDDLDRDRR
ncbi:MAG: ribbon-helix-helix protein, CopG family [Thermoanaerobaculia bacterium]|nr:ribbon-helix-helix protein, CopG family [Thermoanaerobaculia bacterium]